MQQFFWKKLQHNHPQCALLTVIPAYETGIDDIEILLGVCLRQNGVTNYHELY
jgi:hypothetical protein